MDLEKNKPLAREITRRLLDAWRLKRGYKYRSEKRVTHRKLYLALMKEIMHEISHRNIRDIILQRISFFNRNYQTSLSMDQFNDLMSAGYIPPTLPSELDASMEIEGEDDDQGLKMLSPTFGNEEGIVSLGESERKDSKDQILFGQPDGLASLHGYQSDNEAPQNDIGKNSDVRSSTKPDEVQPQEVVHLMDIKSVIEDSIQLPTVSRKEEPIEKADIRTLFSENELLRAELEPMLVYRDDPDMYDRIIAPDIRGKKFKVSNDGRCPKCHCKKNVFVVLDFLFPMGDMPDICNYLIAKGQAVLWSSQDDSHCKDPPTLLCRGRCPADPAKCGFNLNWNRTDLESIFLFPEQAMETKNIVTENSEQSMGSVQVKENDKKTHATFPGIPSQASQNFQPYVSTNDLKQEDANIFDECQVDMDHYKEKVSWVVLDNFADPNEEVEGDEDQLIKTMLALSDAKEDWDQGVAKLWSSESNEESEGDKEDLDVSDEEKSASDIKELDQTEKKSYAFSWSSYGSNPWAPVDFEKKKSQSSASKIIMVATGKAGVPQLLTPLAPDEQQDDQIKESEASTFYKTDTTAEKNKTAATTKEEHIDASKDDDENRKEKLNSSSGETTATISEESSSKDKTLEQSKPYTAADYPVSKDGACPYCKSNEVVYIIINDEENDDGEDNGDDLPDILKKLLKYRFAYKMPKDENELPSFQCLSCTYGFNLDWRSTDLDKIFSKKLEEAEKPKDEDSVSAKTDATKKAATASNKDVNSGIVAENPAILAASAASYLNYNYPMPNPTMSPAYQGYYADPYMFYARMGFPPMPFAQGYFPPTPGFFPPMGFPGYMQGPMPGPMAGPMHGPIPHHIEGSPGMYTSRLTGPRNPYGIPYRRRSQTSVSTRPYMSGTPAVSKPEDFKSALTKSEAATTGAKIVKGNSIKTTSISEDFQTVDSEKKEVEINQENSVGNRESSDEIFTVTEIVATVQGSSTLKRPAVTKELQEDETSIKIEQISDVENSQPLVPGTEKADLTFNAGTEKLDINAIELKVEGPSLISPNIEPLPPGISESVSEDSFHQLPQDSARRNADEPASETGTTINSMDTSKPILQMNEEIGPSENISETAGNRDAAVEDMRGTDSKKQKLDVVDDKGDSVDAETAEDAAVDTETKKAARGRGRGRRRAGGRGRGKAARAKKK